MNVSWNIASAALAKELAGLFFVGGIPVGNDLSVLSWLPSSAVQCVGVTVRQHKTRYKRFVAGSAYITLRAGDSQVGVPARWRCPVS
jgi:hypothetical protein